MDGSIDTSWGQLTDEIQHESIYVGNALMHKIDLTAYHTAQKEAFAKRDFYLVVLYTPNKAFKPDCQCPESALKGGVCEHKKQVRDLVWPRISCPTPVYNQHVFKYVYETKKIEYLWTIPTQQKYYYYLRNAKELMQDTLHSQQVQFCMLMESGQLLDWVKKENGETGKEPMMVLRPKDTEASIAH